MTAEETAQRFDNRTGYRVIAYGAVGLPVYRLTTIALCLAKKLLDPIEEFVLRSIGAGLQSVLDVSGFLGLDKHVVEVCLAELIRADFIRCVPAEDGQYTHLALSARGELVAKDQESIVPREQTIVFCVDGLTRRPKIYPPHLLLRPQVLRDSGTPEISAYPSRPPQLSELDINDVIDTVRLDSGDEESPRQLLKVTSIERVERHFIEVVALVYRSESMSDFQVAFAVDGRISEEHEKAFSKAQGPAKSKLFRTLRDKQRGPDFTQVFGEELAQRIFHASQLGVDPSTLDREAREARRRIAAQKLAVLQQSVDPSNVVLDQLKDVEERRDDLPVRPITIYEHVPILHKALKSSSFRLMVIAPYLRSAVVNNEFLFYVRQAIGRNVLIYIGINLQESDQVEGPWDPAAVNALQSIAAGSKNLVIQRVADVRSNFLVSDNEFFVVTGFEWLSYKGDARRPFREIEGTLVTAPGIVSSCVESILTKFDQPN